MKSKLSLMLILVLCFSSKSFSQANTSLSNLASTTKINHSLTPGTNNYISLGSSSYAWKSLYLTGTVYLYNHKFLSNPGSGNNFFGIDAGKVITSGSYNTGVGYNALYNNSIGTSNTALGYSALYKNDSGLYNTAIGTDALYNNLSGTYNTATGTFAMDYNTTGSYNAASGYFALGYNSTGSYNTASGYGALELSTTADYNEANGYMALYNNTNSYNTANGAYALTSNTSGSNNTATGTSALYHNNTGVSNTANGLNALASNTSGNRNTAVGDDALVNTSASDYNTAVGSEAGSFYNNGYNNVFVGANTDVNGTGYYNVISIGQGTVCTASSQVTMGNSATSSYRAYANWSNISDGRFKKNIKENVPGLVFINKLKPITYTLDATGINNFLQKNQPHPKQINEQAKAVMNKALAEKEKTVFTGFVAQDVEKAAKSLSYDFSGVDAAKNDKDVYGLRYAEFVVPLVKAVQELSKMNDAKDSAIQQQDIKINDMQNQINQLKAMIVSSVNDQQSTAISSASLAQNIPNPFLNSTSISYTLPQLYSSAKIIITDNKGVVLKQINLNTKGKGNVMVDAATLASGAYHYTLYIDGKIIDSKQMISSK